METINEPMASLEFTEARKVFTNYSLMSTAVLISSYFIYGGKVLFMALLSVLTCFVSRILGEKLLGTSVLSRDFACYAIGVTTALLLPVTAPWYFAVLGGFFASTVCILPFGSVLKSPFSPACGAVCFLILCFNEEMFKYSETGLMSLSKMLSQGNSIGSNSVAIMNALTGAFPSAMGTGSVLILVGALIFLTIRQPKNTVPAYTFILTVIAWAFLFPRVSTGRLMSVLMELCSGMVLFSAVFFITYPSVMPTRLISRAIWGVAGGIICMLTRHFGVFEESLCFGILITQAVSGFFDLIPMTAGEKRRIISSPEYTGVESVNAEEAPVLPSVEIPVEVLDEIPDVSEQEDENQPDEEQSSDDGHTAPVPAETENLHDVIAEENSINPSEAVFLTGGDGDEQ